MGTEASVGRRRGDVLVASLPECCDSGLQSAVLTTESPTHYRSLMEVIHMLLASFVHNFLSKVRGGAFSEVLMYREKYRS